MYLLHLMSLRNMAAIIKWCRSIWNSSSEQWLDFHFFSWILYELGGDFFTDDYSKCALTEPEAIEALEYYKMLYDENIMPKAPEKRVDGFQGFVDGYYAMAESGSWWFANIANQAPEIQDKYDVAILPKVRPVYSMHTRIHGHTC